MFCSSQRLAAAPLKHWAQDNGQLVYGSQVGINVDKMFGFLKPKFYSIYDKSVEDFGLIAVDHYLPM